MSLTPSQFKVPDYPSFSRFYTSTLELEPELDRSTYWEKLEEARQFGAISWPEGSRYRIIEAIAVGGMGAILKARDNATQRDIAMKVIFRRESESIVVKRFMRESRIVANLEHPNIVPVHDVGISPLGDPYFTMKLVNGTTLAEILHKVRRGIPEFVQLYPLTKLLDIFLRLCQGVAYAHSKNVIHLDLKPHNVIVGDFGDVLLLDWGLASFLLDNGKLDPLATHIDMVVREAAVAISSGENSINPITECGTIKGTPGFMAPEQALGDMGKLDQRTDVFSLGAILYMIVTLKYPIVGEVESEILKHTIQGNFVPPSKRNSNRQVPLELEAIIMKAMALEKSRRYGSVENFQADLQAFMHGHMTSLDAGKPGKKLSLLMRRHRTEIGWVCLGVALLILFIAVLIYGLNLYYRNNLQEKSMAKSIQKNVLNAKVMAKKNQDLAIFQKQEVIRMKEAAVFQLYLANLRKAQINYQNNRFDLMTEALGACPRDLRHWEWGRLSYLVNLNEGTIDFDEMPMQVGLSANGANLFIGIRGKGIERYRSTELNAPNAILELPSIIAMDTDHEGLLVAALTSENNIYLWNPDTGTSDIIPINDLSLMSGIDLSNDGQKLIAYDNNGVVIVWHVKERIKLKSVRLPEVKGGKNRISEDGTRLFTAKSDYSIDVWDLDHGNLIMTLVGHTLNVSWIEMSRDNKIIVTGGNDHRIIVWSGTTGAILQSLPQFDRRVTVLSLSSNGEYLLFSNGDSLATIWDIKEKKIAQFLKGHCAPIIAAAMNVNGQLIVTLSSDRKLKYWNRSKIHESMRLNGSRGKISALATSLDSRLLATASGDKTVKVWAIESAKELMTLADFTHPIDSLYFTHDGDYLLASGHGNIMKVIKLKTGRERFSLTGHSDRIVAINMSDDNRKIITGSRDHTARIWSAINGRELVTLKGHRDTVLGVNLSVDGEDAITASGDGTIKIWDAESGALRSEFGGFGATISAIGFSLDRNSVVVGLSNGTIEVWSLPLEEKVLDIKGYWDEISSVQISSDNKRLVATGADHSVKIWDYPSGEEMTTLYDPDDKAIKAILSFDNKYIISIGLAGSISIYNSKSLGD